MWRYPYFLGSNGNSLILRALRLRQAGLPAPLRGDRFRQAEAPAPPGGGGAAGCLIRFQLAEAAGEGERDAGFVAGVFGEGVGTLAIDVESAGREVGICQEL